MPNRSSYKYTPYYCEENIWHLAGNKHFRRYKRYVVIISNLIRKVLFLDQRAGDEYGGIIWDYHVVLLTYDNGWYVWDLDSRLPFPCDLKEYLKSSFGFMSEEDGEWSHPRYTIEVIKPYSPLFKVVESPVYIEEFSSNRTHMLDEKGNFRNPPPPWPMIHPRRVNTLRRFIDMTDEEFGLIVTQEELLLLDDSPPAEGNSRTDVN